MTIELSVEEAEAVSSLVASNYTAIKEGVPLKFRLEDGVVEVIKPVPAES